MLKYIKPIVIFTIDGSEQISHTDLALFNRIIDMQLPLVVAVTKIDKLTKNETEKIRLSLIHGLTQMKWIEVVMISSQTKS